MARRGPSVLILDEPTHGVDVGVRAEIYRIVDQLAEQGTGVLLISSDMNELQILCDRILVMRSGRVVATFLGSRCQRRRSGCGRPRVLRRD